MGTMSETIDHETGEIITSQNGPGALVSSNFEFTTTGAVVRGDPTYEEWHEMFTTLKRIESGVQWWLGDMLNYGEAKWGEKYSQALDKTDYTKRTLETYAYVAGNVDSTIRIVELDFAHHQQVANMEIEEQQYWLEQAAKGDDGDPWSVNKLRTEIQQDKISAQLAADPDWSPPTIAQAHWHDWLGQQQPCDLLLTDPPYSTDVDDIESFAADWLPVALAKVKPTGRAYVCIGAYPKELQAYLRVNPGHMRLANVLVWTYENTLGPAPKYDYKLNWQAILYYRGPHAPPLDSPRMVEQFTVQDIRAPDGRLGDRYHEWQKPVDLANRLIRHSTEEGDLVLDPFAGTGSFLVAAGELGRQARGCDIDEGMINIAVKRGCQHV